MGKFDDWECRCSALGNIMSKSGKLTDANKTFLLDVFIGTIYGVRKEAYGKALEKGKYCEEDGISMIGATLLRGQLPIKNKERKHNGFIHGECDVFKNGTVYDVKNAFTLFSFGKASLTWEYEWQLVGYSWLWGAEKAVLYYCLNDMPEHMLEEEKRMLFYKNKWKYLTFESQNYIDDCEELESAHKYSHIPLEERFKYWEVSINKDRFAQIEETVKNCRVYLNQLYEEYEAMINKNKALIFPSITTAQHDKEVNATIIQ